MPKETPGYSEAVNALKPILMCMPPKVVAIDGWDGVGKTTLGRFHSWKFRVPLIETDQYGPKLSGGYELESEVSRLIELQIEKRKEPVFIDAIMCLQILERLGKEPAFHIYVKNTHCSDRINRRSADMLKHLKQYDAKFEPCVKANSVISLEINLEAAKGLCQ
jgi:hypothetical protein